VVRFEALCRWRCPSLGYVSPNRFIPIAEETGLIIPLGDFVLTTACHHAKLWNRRRIATPIRVAVNISPVQFSRADFVAKVTRILDESGLAPQLLQLELTESISLGDVDAAIRKMLQLRGLGISIAMDDFGTGYSSLNYLRRLPIDTLKIDRAFVQDIVCDPTSKNLVGSVISLAHGLGLRVVCEGVETNRQLDALNSLACDELQGFLLGRPISPEQAMELVVGQAVPPAVLPFFKESVAV
jgi:EAL domain-containing protein (putative c-di-GMP-specific phosphodiesterase class I)